MWIWESTGRIFNKKSWISYILSHSSENTVLVILSLPYWGLCKVGPWHTIPLILWKLLSVVSHAQLAIFRALNLLRSSERESRGTNFIVAQCPVNTWKILVTMFSNFLQLFTLTCWLFRPIFWIIFIISAAIKPNSTVSIPITFFLHKIACAGGQFWVVFCRSMRTFMTLEFILEAIVIG